MSLEEQSLDSATSIFQLQDVAEVVLRQVPTTILQPNGVPMKTAFVPSPSDEYMLSTLRASVGPREAHRRWVEDLGLESAGTWGVAVGESESHGLRVIDDSCLPENPSDHSSIDFTSLSQVGRGRLEQVGRKLRDAAAVRGRLHPQA